MEKILKTKVVSEQLGVNPTTVQRWIKYFNIRCDTNDHGHYLIAPQQLEFLQKIKYLLNEGLTMKEIHDSEQMMQMNVNVNVNEKKENKQRMLPAHIFEESFEKLMNHIEQLERKLDVKADEVVAYQVLQHRTELDNLFSNLSRIEEKMGHLEQQQHPIEKQKEKDLKIVPEQFKKRQRNMLMKIFSF